MKQLKANEGKEKKEKERGRQNSDIKRKTNARSTQIFFINDGNPLTKVELK